VPLLEQVVFQISARVKEGIKIKNILEQPSKNAMSKLSEGQKLLESWRNSYMEVRARIEEGGAGKH